MNYKEQYKHPKWQKRRLEILNRDLFTCQKCGDDDTTLHVHHLIYYKGRNVWDYRDFDLITLCKDCHREIENIKPSKKEFKRIKIVKSDGWVGGSKILFVSNKGILHMGIYDDDDGGFIVGYNITKRHLDKIKKIISYTITNG